MTTVSDSPFKLLQRHSSVVWSLVKNQLLLTSVLVFLTAVGDVGVTWLTQQLYDAVSASLADPAIRLLLFTLAAIILFRGCMNYVDANFDIIGRDLLQNVRGKLLCKLHDKANRCSALHFEDPAFLEDLNKAKSGVEGATSMVFILVLMLAYYLPYYLMMTVYFIRLDPLLGLILPISVAPSALSFFLRARNYQSIEEEVVRQRRRYEYFTRLLYEKRSFKEIRTSGAYAFLSDNCRRALRGYNEVYKKKELAAFWRELLAKTVEAAGYLAIVLLLINSFLRGSITEGSFAAVFASINTFLHAVNGLIQRHMGSVASTMPAIHAYYRFMDFDAPKANLFVGPAEAEKPAVELQSVSFFYPGAQRPSLREVNLRIAEGEFVAIVGENGAGKSTLLKILCGLYHPTTGTALLRAAPADLSAVFQNYQRYAMTLAENIAISAADASVDTKLAAAALQEVGLDETQKYFPEGMDTLLSKEFGGTELSGGQWQRVAIARGLYRGGTLLVLDEPTAAIDALEEKSLYEMFRRAAQGRTCVLITHRLGAARIADRILVMKDGQLAASGTHMQLLESCQEYQRLYAAQSDTFK